MCPPSIGEDSWKLHDGTFLDSAPLPLADFNLHSFSLKGFPGVSDGNGSTCNSRNLGLIPGSGRSPGKGIGISLQDSCGKNPMDRGAWWVTVHEVAKSQTQLSSEHLKVKVSQSRLTLCDLVSPLSMKFPGKNTAVGSRSLLQGFFPTLVSCTACRVFTI